MLVLDIIDLEKIYIPKHDREYCLKEKCSRENKHMRVIVKKGEVRIQGANVMWSTRV